MRYLVLLKRLRSEESLSASVPGLPGCRSQGTPRGRDSRQCPARDSGIPAGHSGSTLGRGGQRGRGPPLRVTDAHVHVQPWDELKPEVLEVMTRSHADEIDTLREIMRRPEALLRRL